MKTTSRHPRTAADDIPAVRFRPELSDLSAWASAAFDSADLIAGFDPPARDHRRDEDRRGATPFDRAAAHE